MEAIIFAGALAVLLTSSDRAADGAVDAVLGNENSAFQPQRFAQSLLPQHHRLRVCDRGELVIQQDFGFKRFAAASHKPHFNNQLEVFLTTGHAGAGWKKPQA